MSLPVGETKRSLCRCKTPRPHIDDVRRPNTCVVCIGHIPPEWGSENVGRLLDRLAESIPGAVNELGEESPAWAAFRGQCDAREKAGRGRYGLSFHGRNNPVEAQEEASDGALYACFDQLVHRRHGGGEEDIDLVLVAAQKFYEAHEALSRLRHKRQGEP